MNGVTVIRVTIRKSQVFFALLDATAKRRSITISKAWSSLNSFRSTLAAISSSNLLAARLERRRLQMQTPRAEIAQRRKSESPVNRATLTGIAKASPLQDDLAEETWKTRWDSQRAPSHQR